MLKHSLILAVLAVGQCACYLSASAASVPGIVFAWGDNSAGQTNIPPDLTDVTAIAGGLGHSLALKSDGTVVGWGSNGYTETTAHPWVTNVAAIAAGHEFSLIL
jgi:alpha-tubulin suppressor-like RCC1 family protein